MDALHNEGQVVGLAFDSDTPEALEDARLDGGATASERLEDGAAGWGDELDQLAHEGERLHGGMRSHAGFVVKRLHPRPAIVAALLPRVTSGEPLATGVARLYLIPAIVLPPVAFTCHASD